jgi:hypothetical protein
VFVQARPHIPQFVDELSAVSQPFALIASQSPKPVAQAYSQRPEAEHVGTMLGRAAHEPHVPPQPSLPHSRPAHDGAHASDGALVSMAEPSLIAASLERPASIAEALSSGVNCAS